MITIIDYKMGNLGSIVNMLRRLGFEAAVGSERKHIENATKLILPGVGSFDSGIRHLHELGLNDLLEQKVMSHRIPFLGICLGMQLLCKGSEEGMKNGLGWIDAETVRFPNEVAGESLRIPHMGWNEISVKKQNPLFKDLDANPRFYFVHGFHVQCADPEAVAATTTYGIEFHSSVRKDNIYGVQFHPEKSHKFGMQLLKNFAELNPHD